jgi:hypothetical protein
MGGLRWRGAAITAAAVAVIVSCSLVGMLVWAPSGFELWPPGPRAADASGEQRATDSCTINGAGFLRSLVTSCVSPAAGRAATSSDRSQPRALSSRWRDVVDRVRGRRARPAPPADAAKKAAAPRAGPAPVLLAPTPPAPVAPLPSPLDPAPLAPIPVDPVEVVSLPVDPAEVVPPILGPLDALDRDFATS